MPPYVTDGDGNVLSKYQAARALNVTGGTSLVIRAGLADKQHEDDYIEAYPRHHAFGAIAAPYSSCSSRNGDALGMRRRTAMMTLAADIIDLANEIDADEQAAAEWQPRTDITLGAPGTQGRLVYAAQYARDQHQATFVTGTDGRRVAMILPVLELDEGTSAIGPAPDQPSIIILPERPGPLGPIGPVEVGEHFPGLAGHAQAAAITYGTGTDQGRPAVTCTTPDGVTAPMMFARSPEGAAAIAAALNENHATAADSEAR